MKKNFFTVLSLCLALTAGYSQAVKNKTLASAAAASAMVQNNAEHPDDVSTKGMIRYNTDITTPEQRAQADYERLQYLQSVNPNYAADRNAYEQQIQEYIRNNQARMGNSTQSVITLPVVVHVVYKTAAQNIPDNQVFSQIQVLNEDFGRTNADANTHWSQAANTTIQFCLAQQDPNGNVTNGIDRVSTTVTSFGTNDNVKHANTGGANAWDPTRYLNIWVCNLGSGLLGYGEFPTASVSQTMGVVILYSAFGSNYTSYGTFSAVQSPYDRGRTTTHEFSHCFNLYHIWGDDGGACSGSDQCSDTPNQADATTTCYTYPHTDACATSNPGIMFENYMDYSYDNCLNLFTTGQTTRMLAVLNSSPYNALQTSNGCQSPVAVGLDAGISAITTPSGTICGTTFTPVVTLKNFGATTLTSCTINYKIDNNTVQTYNWSGTLTSGNTATVTLSSMTTTATSHTFTCYTSAPNSGTDANTANDQITSTFTCVSGGVTPPVFEGFEGTTFVPSGWTLNNPDGGITWARTTTAAKTGVASAMMDNWSYQGGNGQRDEMTMMPINMTTLSNPVLTFQVAYVYWTVPYTYSDTLEVLASTDCGATWTTVYKKWGANLMTGTPLSSTTAAWVPGAADWRMETVSLLPYTSANALYIKFRNISDYEDNLYIDDINIMNSTGMASSPLANSINLFPNPSNTGMFNMNVSLGQQENMTITVTNTLGQVVSTVAENNTYGGMYSIDLSAQPNGVYFVEVAAGDQKTVQRIVINK
jgi:hypothetical protein